MTSVVRPPDAVHDTNQPYYSPNNAPEWERLDDLHRGIDAYLGHKLSLGPSVHNVKKILEIGCGSGAWAIQAAQAYPEATVIAIDISPLPSRPLPSNMQFLQLNVTESLPFEPENFDIIHARFIFVHLPNWKQVLENIVSLLKPRGWLWIEDADIHFYDDGPQDLAPSLKAFNDTYLASARAKNVDPLAGSSLNAVLKSMKCFSEVNSIEIKCPTNGQENDPNIQWMGQVIWTALRRSLTSTKSMYNATGMTPELKEEISQEAQDPLRSVFLKIYMVWSQKK
ncbi:hypothetical protein H2248_008219 [Termitomyces sp. 'cryptogamus']|nr:hypothetical protein H2248_008219 [Termitomyces sp. 'cryptogamus']